MNPGALITGLMLVAVGIFSICGAAMDWDFFINHYKARLVVSMFGRNGARVFYGILGAVVAVLGLLIALGLVSGERKRQRFRLPTQNEVNERDLGLVYREPQAEFSEYSRWTIVVRRQTDARCRCHGQEKHLT